MHRLLLNSLQFFKNLHCFVGTLCSGSTTDFDSVSLGSIPSVPAIDKHTSAVVAVLNNFCCTTFEVCFSMVFGRVGEWFKPAVLKTADCKRSLSSNLSSSAKFIESWMSGLNQQFAKLSFIEKWTKGSNPLLSAIS